MKLSSLFEAAEADGLAVIGKDGERVLLRGGHTDADGSRNAVLAVLLVDEGRTTQSLGRLSHEFALREALDSAWAARPIAIRREHGQTMLLLEDPGGEPLQLHLGQPMEIGRWLRLAIGLARALSGLHERGIIHKDIKPSNVLVNLTTGKVWLTGFGIASQLPRERQAPEPPEVIAGTLAYMAPEQTGRMNRSIDCRSDLYALGGMLYEMLTGSLPFAASDPTEWVHCHIARKPAPPAERRGDLPEPLSAIVLKLLAKTAEQRYQTAAGLERDLRRCLAEWEGAGRIDPFPLGLHDMPDRLVIPEKLYGREREITTLLAAFERVVTGGAPELVLISGYSGLGKSAVINELQKVLTPLRGLFASGKFEQYKRDIPYASLAQALRGLIRPLLGKSEAELAPWREAFAEALGANGQLMATLIPELELILGAQPTVPELPPQDAQRRFQVVFRRLLGVLARPDHPLVLFLDDLQWLDAATLDLLEHLATQPELRYLLLVGTYRENEVTPAHPLMRRLADIRGGGAPVQEIVLAPLGLDDLNRLVADALYCGQARAAPLARLVHEKTGGNPFFVIQFLTALAEAGLLAFDHGQTCWSWDLERIHAKGYTDNVVDLLLGKLRRLPEATQDALQKLACLGNVAETTILSLVQGRSEEAVQEALWAAVEAGLVLRQKGTYRFLHDRVREAVYALIPEGERAAAHLAIGRRLAAHTPPEAVKEGVFEIVGQLNRGAALIGTGKEREQVAELNLIAGRRARASTAYASALIYFSAGATLLPEDAWGGRPELLFELELHRAECEFLTGALAEAGARLTDLTARALSLPNLAAVVRLRVDLFMTLGRSDQAVAVGLDYLRRIGIAWSVHPTKDDVRQEYGRMWRQIGDRPLEVLLHLPRMADPVARATMDVLTSLVSPALFTDENLRCLVIGRMGNLSLEHGNSDGSCYAYTAVGNVLALFFGDYKAAFRFGQLGLDMVEQSGVERFKPRVYLAFGNLARPSLRHFPPGRPLAQQAFDTALQAGDLTYAAFSCNNILTQLLASGHALAEVQREAEAGLDFARQARFGLVEDLIIAQLTLLRALHGQTAIFGSSNDPVFDESRFEQRLEEDPRLSIAAWLYWIRKLQALVFAADHAAAIAAASKAERLLWMSPAIFERAEYHFYAALARASLCGAGPSAQQARHWEALAKHHRQLQEWGEHCPENFASRAALVGAEIARIEGSDVDAMHLYEKAIRSARDNGLVHNEALACELAARFYTARGFEINSHAHLRSARNCYLRWGADSKVRQLDALHRQLAQDEPAPGPTRTIGAPIEHLDLATVIKVSQAISGEIVLEKLIDRLLRTAIEQAGAERGLLVLSRGGEPRVAAEAATGKDTVVRLRDERVAATTLPESVFHYVLRARESVLLDDASAETPFSADPYIRQCQARSILCMPLINQSKLIGVLYLENNLAPGVFAPARTAVLKLLASQAAIALENSSLYRDLAEREAKIRETQMELAHANRVAAMGQLTASIAHEVKQPIASAVTHAQAALRWLEVRPPDLNEVRDALGDIVRDGYRGRDVIDRIRALVKKAPLQKDRLDINEAVGEVIALTRSEAMKNDVSVRTQFAEGLPLAHGDRVQLQQVALNLIINAIQAMRDIGDEPREVLISTLKAEPESVVVAVSDTGPGLDEEALSHIFEAFFTTKPDGTGMGLSICSSIVGAHGGRLWVTANKPRGAVFQFTVPAPDGVVS